MYMVTGVKLYHCVTPPNLAGEQTRRRRGRRDINNSQPTFKATVCVVIVARRLLLQLWTIHIILLPLVSITQHWISIANGWNINITNSKFYSSCSSKWYCIAWKGQYPLTPAHLLSPLGYPCNNTNDALPEHKLFLSSDGWHWSLPFSTLLSCNPNHKLNMFYFYIKTKFNPC